MKNFENMPKPLFQKILFTVLIGIGCLTIGIAYFFITHDRIFFGLSGVLCLLSLFRGFELYRIISKQKYHVVEGTCIGISSNPLKKQKKVKVMDNSGIESTLYINKKTSLKIGFLYRFYFTQAQQKITGSEFFDNALSSNQFLGFEEIGEFGTASPETDEITETETNT